MEHKRAERLCGKTGPWSTVSSCGGQCLCLELLLSEAFWNLCEGLMGINSWLEWKSRLIFHHSISLVCWQRPWHLEWLTYIAEKWARFSGELTYKLLCFPWGLSCCRVTTLIVLLNVTVFITATTCLRNCDFTCQGLWTLLPEQALVKPSDASVKGIGGVESHAGFLEHFLTDELKGAVLAILDVWHTGLLFIENVLRREESKLFTFPLSFLPSFFPAFPFPVLLSFFSSLLFSSH